MNLNPNLNAKSISQCGAAVRSMLVAALALGLSHSAASAQGLSAQPAADMAQAALQGALDQPFPTAAGADVLAQAAPAGRTAVLRSSAYNSLAGQTDSTPHITATGTRTRVGVVALSRDMLRLFPYGSKVRIEDLSGNHPYVNGRVFYVEDTMHARKTGQIDIWMPTRSQALNWGVRQVRITAVE